MLTDPFGVKMEADLRRGIHYPAFSDRNYYEWSTAYSILKLCAESRNPKICQCCLRRLKLVYRHGGDPRVLESYEYDNPSPYISHVDMARRAFNMDLDDLVRDALCNAGWSLYDIQNYSTSVLYILRNTCSARWRGQLHNPG